MSIKTEKIFYLVAGANGSGKTTLSQQLLPTDNLVFLNADEIAKSINQDSIESVKITAGKELLKQLKIVLESGKNFAMETTLSGTFHQKVITKAKRYGYKIILVYIFLDKPEYCINRIKVRVQMGGHNIPDDDVRRRYHRSKDNFWYLYKDIVDKWGLYYNGASPYVKVAQGMNSHIDIMDKNLYNYFTKDL